MVVLLVEMDDDHLHGSSCQAICMQSAKDHHLEERARSKRMLILIIDLVVSLQSFLILILKKTNGEDGGIMPPGPGTS